MLQIVANKARNRRRSAGRRAHLAAKVAAAEVMRNQIAASPEVVTLAERHFGWIARGPERPAPPDTTLRPCWIR